MSAHIDKVDICIERLKALASRLENAGHEADNPAHRAGFWMENEAIEVLLAYVTKLRGQVAGQPCPTCSRLKDENEAMREVVEAAREFFACNDEGGWIELGAAIDRFDAIAKEQK